jgi:hypothetical protein
MKPEERDQLLRSLESRFEKNPGRHKGLAWAKVRARIESVAAALQALGRMEASGGEPDVIGEDSAAGQVIFCDCAAESPAGRRSLCYDSEALEARKENKPAGSAVQMAAGMGVEFDTKTSSWIATPADVRSLGGALFCDRRYGKVFVYHNGAQSYYAARGFRGLLRV